MRAPTVNPPARQSHLTEHWLWGDRASQVRPQTVGFFSCFTFEPCYLMILTSSNLVIGKKKKSAVSQSVGCILYNLFKQYWRKPDFGKACQLLGIHPGCRFFVKGLKFVSALTHVLALTSVFRGRHSQQLLFLYWDIPGRTKWFKIAVADHICAE